MVALRDRDAQRKGFVFVALTYGGKPESFSVCYQMAAIRVALPIHVFGRHMCYNSPVMLPMVTGAKLFLNGVSRFLFQAHYGDFDVVQSKLCSSVGVSATEFSKIFDGSWHEQWMKMHQSRSPRNENESEAIINPRRFDVLFGKTKRAREHPGTVRCQVMVDIHWERYEIASRRDKTAVADEVVAAVHASGGRFLQLVRNVWVEVSHEHSREKISHFFRQKRETKARAKKHRSLLIRCDRPTSQQHDIETRKS